MISRRFSADAIAGVAVLAALALLINPSNILMLSMGAMTVVSFFAIAVLAFAALVWRERSHDERESLLIGVAGRIAYLIGAGVLSVGIIFQTFAHALDMWLVTALAMMVCTKLIATIYYRNNK